jgi:hypothetical protein
VDLKIHYEKERKKLTKIIIWMQNQLTKCKIVIKEAINYSAPKTQGEKISLNGPF